MDNESTSGSREQNPEQAPDSPDQQEAESGPEGQLPEGAQENEPDNQPEDQAEEEQEQPETEPDQSGKAGALPLILLLLAMAAALAFSRPELRTRLIKSDERRMTIWIQALLDAMAAMGMRRKASESVGAFLTGACERRPGMRTAVRRFASGVSAYTYGDGKATRDREIHGRQAWSEARHAMTLRERLRLDLRRAFLPRRLRWKSTESMRRERG